MLVNINVNRNSDKFATTETINMNDFEEVYGTGTYMEYVTADSRSFIKSINVYNDVMFTVVDNLRTSVLTVTVYNTTLEIATHIGELVKKEIEHFEEECVLTIN